MGQPNKSRHTWGEGKRDGEELLLEEEIGNTGTRENGDMDWITWIG